MYLLQTLKRSESYMCMSLLSTLKTKAPSSKFELDLTSMWVISLLKTQSCQKQVYIRGNLRNHIK